MWRQGLDGLVVVVVAVAALVVIHYWVGTG
jgi:hypothetical protein